MKTFTLRQRLRYAFDHTLSRGTPALIAWLALLTVASLVVASVLLVLLGAAPSGETGDALSFPELVWHNLMRTLDAGTMGGDTGSALYLLMMLVVTLGGVFIVGTLIGLISTAWAIKSRSSARPLRRGRNRPCRHPRLERARLHDRRRIDPRQ